jgi:hypothetical protein
MKGPEENPGSPEPTSTISTSPAASVRPAERRWVVQGTSGVREAANNGAPEATAAVRSSADRRFSTAPTGGAVGWDLSGSIVTGCRRRFGFTPRRRWPSHGRALRRQQIRAQQPRPRLGGDGGAVQKKLSWHSWDGCSSGKISICTIRITHSNHVCGCCLALSSGSHTASVTRAGGARNGDRF